MKDLAVRRYDMFNEAKKFCGQYPELFPGGTYGGNLVAALSEVISKLTNYFKEQTAQMDAARSSYSSKAALKSELLVELKSISKNARKMGQTIRGIAEKFYLPDKLTEQELVSKARSFVEAAIIHEKEFIEHAMRADFLPRLKTILAAYEDAIDKSSTATGAQVAATAGIEVEIDKGMDLVERIELVVENNCYNDKLIMHAWKDARHVEKARIASKAEKLPSKPPEAPPAPVSEKP